MREVRLRFSGRRRQDLQRQGHRRGRPSSAASSPSPLKTPCWAYTLGAAIAIKKGCKDAADAAEAIGVGLQAFCIPGSVADQRQVGLGHGNLAAMLLREETKCFCFLAGHESFAAAEGAIGIAKTANKVRKQPLRVILNGLGKDAAMIISRINGFTYVRDRSMITTTGELNIVEEKRLLRRRQRAKVRCYGADDVSEGVAIMRLEERRRFHHRQLHQPHALPASRRGHLQEMVLSKTARSTSPSLPAAAPAVPCIRTTWPPALLQLRHDRHHGPHARRRAVRRFLLRARARGDDGPHRHGQQPHGRRVRRGRGRGRSRRCNRRA